MAAKTNFLNSEKYIKVDEPYLDYLRSSARDSLGHVVANLLVDEFFKFFILATNFPEKNIKISQAIDTIWHFAILETKHYRKLNCDNNSGHFLDHSKLEEKNQKSASAGETKEALEFCLNYVSFFGEFPEGTLQYWPQANLLARLSNISEGQLNDLIAQLSEENSFAGEI